jgi:hypothetical protein
MCLCIAWPSASCLCLASSKLFETPFTQVNSPEYRATHDASQWRCWPGCHLPCFREVGHTPWHGPDYFRNLSFRISLDTSPNTDNRKHIYLRSLLLWSLVAALCFWHETNRFSFRLTLRHSLYIIVFKKQIKNLSHHVSVPMAARTLGSRVRIPLGAWMLVSAFFCRVVPCR